MKNKNLKEIGQFAIGNVMLGIGSTVAVKAGGSAAGMEGMSKMMPAMGTVMGAGMVMDYLPKKKKII